MWAPFWELPIIITIFLEERLYIMEYILMAGQPHLVRLPVFNPFQFTLVVFRAEFS